MEDKPEQPVDLDPVEEFGDAPDCGTGDLLERGRRAILRAEALRRSAQLHALPPGGTLHA
jgi:hypothetical protein